MISSSDCLLARAIPMPAKSKPMANDQIDSLATQFDAAIKLENKPKKAAVDGKGEENRKKRVDEIISPADHLALQSLRSSALARKMNTTAKFSRDCRNLFADLLHGNEAKKEEGEAEEKPRVVEAEKEERKQREEGEERENKKKEEEEDGQEKEEDGQLIARGPVRANFIGHAIHSYHPYGASQANDAQPTVPPPFNAAAPQSTVLDQSSLNPMATGYGGYECGLPSTWSYHSGWSSGGRDSVLSSPSSTPDSTGPDMGQLMMSPGGPSERSELPDDLSDFILEYSRRYSPILSRKTSYSDGATPRSSTVDSPCPGGGESPLSAPQSSPAAPRSGATSGPRTPPCPQTMTKQGSMELANRPAKERLRAMIRSEDMDDAWAWTCKCIQRHPGALTFQDGDRDTLLHIVTSHLDLAKIYALVEQMLKLEVKPGELPPFDMANGMGETPLMVAVQKRQCEVVDYLLEAGAIPNVQSTRLERDMPLHYAACRGMAAIARVICADPRTNLNAQNGMGLSPLLCAFKSHGVMEEESQTRVDNLETAQVLLGADADAMVGDATNGRTLAHYAVERMDERLIELLRSHLGEHKLAQLVNQADFCGETPMGALKGMELEQEQKARMCLALITSGVDASGKTK